MQVQGNIFLPVMLFVTYFEMRNSRTQQWTDGFVLLLRTELIPKEMQIWHLV